MPVLFKPMLGLSVLALMSACKSDPPAAPSTAVVAPTDDAPSPSAAAEAPDAKPLTGMQPPEPVPTSVQYLAFLDLVDGGQRLFLSRADGSERRELFAAPGGGDPNLVCPAWSPDGQSLQVTGKDAAGAWTRYQVQLNGQHLVLGPTELCSGTRPSLSPDLDVNAEGELLWKRPGVAPKVLFRLSPTRGQANSGLADADWTSDRTAILVQRCDAAGCSLFSVSMAGKGREQLGSGRSPRLQPIIGG